MFDIIISWLERLSQTVHPLLFVVVGSFAEEIIAPIPSPLIMATTAALAHSLSMTWWDIFWLLLVAAIGKTIASYLVYVLADKAEDLVLLKFGRYLGVSHSSVERIGKLLNRGYWDDVILLVLRSLPIVPSVLVSVASGVLKINLRTYLATTFIGTLIRNGLYFSILYFGWGQAEAVWLFIQDKVELAVLGLIALMVLGWLAIRIKRKLEARILKSDEADKKT